MSSDSCIEQQSEEREALQSIYDGDNAFKQINLTTFQYKYGQEDDVKSFLLELEWGEQYPNEMPTINLGAFYNRNLGDKAKLKIESIVNEEAQQWLGSGMTYTLFECLKDHIIDILSQQEQAATITDENKNTNNNTILSTKGTGAAVVSQKKPQLTKSQKRRQWEQSDHKGDKPRGYNWVDLVKHLSQVGNKDESGARPTEYQ